MNMSNCALAEAGLIDTPPEEAFTKKRKLVLPPKERLMEPPPGCESYKEKPLSVRYQNSLDWTALVLNLLTAMILSCVMFFSISYKTHNPMFRVALPLTIVFVVATCIFKRLWVSVDGLQAKFYLDCIFRELIIYGQGFNFTTWFSKDQGREIDYQKHVKVGEDGDKGKTKSFEGKTLDGYDTAVQMTVTTNLLDTPEAVCHSLKYKSIEEINTAISAWIEARWSDITGLNHYEVILENKSEVIAWLENLLGGDSYRSSLEVNTGSVVTLRAGNIGLTGESQKTYEAKTRLELIEEQTAKLRALGITPDAALEGAQIALKLIDKTVNEQKYSGIPDGVHTFAPGGAFAVTGKGK